MNILMLIKFLIKNHIKETYQLFQIILLKIKYVKKLNSQINFNILYKEKIQKKYKEIKSLISYYKIDIKK